MAISAIANGPAGFATVSAIDAQGPAEKQLEVAGTSRMEVALWLSASSSSHAALATGHLQSNH